MKKLIATLAIAGLLLSPVVVAAWEWEDVLESCQELRNVANEMERMAELRTLNNVSMDGIEVDITGQHPEFAARYFTLRNNELVHILNDLPTEE